MLRNIILLAAYLLPIFAYSQKQVILPSMEIKAICDTSISLLSHDKIYISHSTGNSFTYGIDLLNSAGISLQKWTETIGVDSDTSWFDIQKEFTFSPTKGVNTQEFILSKSTTLFDSLYTTEQSFFLSQTEDGVAILDLYSIRVIENKLYTIYRNLFDFAEDSVELRFFFSNKKAGNENLKLFIYLNQGERQLSVKKVSISTLPGLNTIRVPLGNLPSSLVTGGKIQLSVECFTEEKMLRFSFNSIQILFKGDSRKTAAGNIEDDPYFLNVYSDQDLNKFAEISLLFANSSERDIYNGINSIQTKRKFLTSFWRKREVPSEPFLPKFTDLINRMRIASELRLEYLGTKYYKTDRGRVILQYGVPDEIQKVPFGKSPYPIQIWTYNSIEQGVVFYFMDFNKNGEFRLAHSTKRGELYNPNFEASTE